VRVLKEGELRAGDSVTFITRDEHAVSVGGCRFPIRCDDSNQDLLRRASELPALPETARLFQEALWEPDEMGA